MFIVMLLTASTMVWCADKPCPSWCYWPQVPLFDVLTSHVHHDATDHKYHCLMCWQAMSTMTLLTTSTMVWCTDKPCPPWHYWPQVPWFDVLTSHVHHDTTDHKYHLFDVLTSHVHHDTTDHKYHCLMCWQALSTVMLLTTSTIVWCADKPCPSWCYWQQVPLCYLLTSHVHHDVTDSKYHCVICWQCAHHGSTNMARNETLDDWIIILLKQYLHCTGKCLYPAHLLLCSSTSSS